MALGDAATVVAALTAVLVAAALGGMVGKLAGIPTVAGQMCGGVLLGPLCVGSLFPAAYDPVFTADNKAAMARLGTIAAAAFLFVAGASHPDLARTRRRDVGMLAGVNAAVAALAAALLIVLIRSLDTAELDRWQSCYLALVLTCCAVPVLVRIIEEKHLTGHTAARYAVAVAVSTDVLVWCVVAVLDGGAHGNARRAALDAGIVAAVIILWQFARNRVRRMIGAPRSEAAVLVTAGLCVACGVGVSLLAGVDPLIGSLLGGVVFGAGRVGRPPPWFLRPGWLRRVLNHVALPIFFGSAGLAAAPKGSIATLAILAVTMTAAAIAVRAAAVYGTGRWTPLGRAELRTIFWLVCARGGTELALLKVGLNAGLLPAALYPPAVLMAIVTTLASGVLAPAARPAGVRVLRVAKTGAFPKGQ
jgi:Kef-type K+ transport system membrane component KefB